MDLPIWDDSIDTEENYIRTKISLNDWSNRSGASIFTQLKDAGFSIGETKFYDIRRDVLNIVRHQEQLESLSSDILIPRNYMDYVPTWNISANYQYNLKYTYRVGDSNVDQESYFTISSDQRLSKDEIEQQARDNLSELRYEKDGTEISIGNVNLQHVYRKS